MFIYYGTLTIAGNGNGGAGSKCGLLLIRYAGSGSAFFKLSHPEQEMLRKSKGIIATKMMIDTMADITTYLGMVLYSPCSPCCCWGWSGAAPWIQGERWPWLAYCLKILSRRRIKLQKKENISIYYCRSANIQQNNMMGLINTKHKI